MKDWTGNKRTLGALLGASNHTSEDRQREDYYATDPAMVRDLLNAGAPLRQCVWEPACGDILLMYCVNVGTKCTQPILLTGDALIPAC